MMSLGQQQVDVVSCDIPIMGSRKEVMIWLKDNNYTDLTLMNKNCIEIMEYLSSEDRYSVERYFHLIQIVKVSWDKFYNNHRHIDEDWDSFTFRMSGSFEGILTKDYSDLCEIADEQEAEEETEFWIAKLLSSKESVRNRNRFR